MRCVPSFLLLVGLLVGSLVAPPPAEARQRAKGTVRVERMLQRWDEDQQWERIEAFGRERLDAQDYTLFQRDQLIAMIAFARTRRAAFLAGHGRRAEAIEVLRSLLRDVPEHTVGASRALYNIGVLHDALGQRVEAAKAFEELVTRYPGGRLAVTSRFHLGHLYLAQGRDLNAAEMLASLESAGAAALGDRRRYRSALLDAAQIFRLHGDSARARGLLHRFSTAFPHDFEAPRVALEVARLTPAGKARNTALARVVKRFVRLSPEVALVAAGELAQADPRRLGAALATYRRTAAKRPRPAPPALGEAVLLDLASSVERADPSGSVKHRSVLESKAKRLEALGASELQRVRALLWLAVFDARSGNVGGVRTLHKILASDAGGALSSREVKAATAAVRAVSPKAHPPSRDHRWRLGPWRAAPILRAQGLSENK